MHDAVASVGDVCRWVGLFARAAANRHVSYLWILSGIACFAIVANKDVRYTAPVLPGRRTHFTCWLREFKPRGPLASLGIRKSCRRRETGSGNAIAAWAGELFNAQWPNPGWGHRYRHAALSMDGVCAQLLRL
jgi:hypothetical protein